MTGHAAARPFDIAGPLPTGITVLEASAGTGKTYTIAALAARYVAEGTPLDRLLLVTFTRMATGELRERVRERLVSVERGLAHALAGGGANDADPVVRLLTRGGDSELRLKHRRLVRALADFDAATIATTHGFCQEVLAGLGVTGDIEREATFVEDVGVLVDEVIDDLYVRRFHRHGNPPFGRRQAAEIARIAIENPTAPIVEATGEVPAMRRRLADAARREFDLRKRRMAVMTYDDLLTRLDGTLTGAGGTGAAARLRSRYSVVLIDEFQDTDPVQWDIVRKAFGDGARTLVLIGDPKQAIYAFRGADVYAYLDAARSADTQATLETNWRSDQGLIEAYDVMFVGAKLGHEGIVYRRVRAADQNRAPRLRGAPADTPVRVRFVHRDQPSIELTRNGSVKNASAREHVANDLAADLVRLLSSPAEIEHRDDEGASVARESVRPGHVAVLVRTNRNAALVRDALEDVGVPAVINGAGSVFATPPAGEWLRLLEALERPTSPTRARSLALTCFLGWSPEQMAVADEDAWEGIHRRLHGWARVLRLRGVAALMETITLVEGLPERILATEEGERRLTDLRHVGQLLHATASGDQLGVTAVTAWLRSRIAEAADDTSDEERSRRLESDAEAVQVLTIHRSKGLEFPVVYLPFLWEAGFIPPGDRPVSFHDPDAGYARAIDVALEGSVYRGHKHQALVEQRGEDLRLAYVALTRARHQAVIWWAGSWDSRNSPLGRLLFARDDAGNIAAEGSQALDDAEVHGRFEALAEQVPRRLAVEPSRLGLPTCWTPPTPEIEELGTAVFDRGLDRRWRRTSYSDIAAGGYEHRVASEPETAVVVDEPDAPLASSHPGEPVDPSLRMPSLLGDMPVGLKVGTFVHRVLEATDFDAPDLGAELTERVEAALAHGQVEIGDPATCIAGLAAAVETPLGARAGDLRLGDVRRADRLDELDFELPLAGGDDPTGEVTLKAITELLRHALDPGDPLGRYAARLEDPTLRRNVRGYLTGSIDCVMRLPDDRFAVVDYKTNWLAGADEPLTAWHYRPAALAAEMVRGHYGLQALLYIAALHRYLRWRLPGYHPERNLAGVFYLFVRGMLGPDAPTMDGTPVGVFAWKPPTELVAGLSDILDGRAT